MKKLILALTLSTSLVNLSAQQHYLWPAESTTKDFGRIIDVIEFSPGMVAYQSLLFSQDWNPQNMLLGTIDLSKGHTSFIDTLGLQDKWYRAGFGKLSDNSLVVSCNTKLGYQISHYSFDKTKLEFKRGSNIMAMSSTFLAGSGGVCTLKNGGYVAVMLYQDKANSRYDGRILLLNDESKFKSPPFDYLTTVSENLIMKPYLIDPMYNYHYIMSDGKFGYSVEQVLESPEGNILAFNGISDKENNVEPKIWSFNNKMELEWETSIPHDGYGYRPLAAGKGGVVYLTTFIATTQGYTQTKISAYVKNIKQDKLVCAIDSFEANGCFVMADQNLCAYGFSTHHSAKYGDYSNKYPAYYILDGKTLQVISSWELGVEDQPCKDVSAKYGAGTMAPGKFYTGTQLADGSLVFGGHLLGIVTDPATTKEHGLFCNYMVKFTSKEWGKK